MRKAWSQEGSLWMYAAVVMLACSSLVFVLRCSSHITALQSREGLPRATVAEREFDFGEVEPGTQVRHLFAVSNQGNRRLVLNLVDCQCGETPSNHLTVRPGEVVNIPVEMTIHSRLKQQHRSLTIATNDPASPSLEFMIRASAAI